MLSQLLAVLSVGACATLVAGAGCTPANTSPPLEDPTDEHGEKKPCRSDINNAAEWPAGTGPDFDNGINEVCFRFPAEGGEKACNTSFSQSCILREYRAHGILPRAERHALAVHALEAVIAPAATTAMRVFRRAS